MQLRTIGYGLAALAILLTSSTLLTSKALAGCVGFCGVSSGVDGDVTAPPTGGSYRWISTFTGTAGAGQLPSIGGTNGSEYSTAQFTANAGASLDYYFNYVTSDGQNPTDPGRTIYEDYTWVQLRNNVGNAVATLLTARTEPSGTIIPGLGLPNIDATLTPASVPIISLPGGAGPTWSPLGDPTASGSSTTCWGPGCGYTGWVHSTFVIPTDGTYQLVFGVTNWIDNVYDSGLAFTGITVGGTTVPGEDLSEVPIPAAMPLFLTGLGALGYIGRRRKTPFTQIA